MLIVDGMSSVSSCAFRIIRVASVFLTGSLIFCSLIVLLGEAVNPGHFYSRNDLSLTASSTTPVKDKRIAAYFSRDIITGQEVRSCTAANIAENLWITARHCSPKIGDSIRGSGGGKVSVQSVYLTNESDDIAVVKAAPGLKPASFALPTVPPKKGEELTLLGFGAKHDYASAAAVKVVGSTDEYPPELENPRKGMLNLEPTSQSRACEGDSGAPIFWGDTIYAIHSSAATNKGCYDGPGGLIWATSLTPERVNWIKSIILQVRKSNQGSTSLSQRTPASSSALLS